MSRRRIKSKITSDTHAASRQVRASEEEPQVHKPLALKQKKKA